MRWHVYCEHCGHDWFCDLSEEDDPDSAGVQCEVCDSDLVSGSIGGSQETDERDFLS